MIIALGLIAGLAFVILGAELLVRGASDTAAGLGVPPLLIGLTIVAYGTSAPEFAVSVSAGLAGRPELAVANVVGSNVFNVLAIVGLTALITPLAIAAPVVRREIPLMLMATVAAMALAADGRLGRVDGVLLLALMAWLTAASIRGGRADAGAGTPRARPSPRRLLGAAALAAAGLVLLVFGARWLVEAASAGAAALGVSELVVGLTIVAFGTSIPELATSLTAAARGQRDLAIGNVVGSNVFNLLAILGAAAITAPAPLTVAPQVLALDGWVMLGAAVLLLPMAWSGAVIARWEGAILVAAYAVYVGAVVAIAVGLAPVPAPWLGATAAAVPVALVILAAVIGQRRRTP